MKEANDFVSKKCLHYMNYGMARGAQKGYFSKLCINLPPQKYRVLEDMYETFVLFRPRWYNT